MDAIKTIDERGFTISIYPHDNPENPRTENCNLSRIITMRLTRHRLHDKGEDYLPEELTSWAQAQRFLVRNRDAKIVMPLYLYDHGQVAISTRSFIGRAHHAEWDSGQVGLVYATAQNIRDWYGVKRIGRATFDMAVELVRAEIDTFDKYLRGEVYGYVITDRDGLVVASAWGYYEIEFALETARADISLENGYSQGYKIKEG